MVTSAVSFFLVTLSNVERVMATSWFKYWIHFRLNFFKASFTSSVSARARSHCEVQWIHPDVIVTWPGLSLTHFSFFVPLARHCSYAAAKCVLVAAYISASTVFNQCSGLPMWLTGLSNGMRSPSDEIIATDCQWRRAHSGSGGCISNLLMPSNIPFRCGWMASGSFTWPKICSKSSLLKK